MPRSSAWLPVAASPAFCEKPVALELEAVDAVDRRGRAGRDPRPDRLPAALRPGLPCRARRRPCRRARQAAHPARGDARPGAAARGLHRHSGGIFRDLLDPRHRRNPVRHGEEVVEVYADGAVRETEWFGATATSTRQSPSCGSHGGALAILSGTRRDPLGYDVRLEVFGTADSIAVGVDARSPLRSVEPGVAARRRADTATSSTASARPTAPSSPPSSKPCAEAARAPAPSPRRGPRSPSRSRPTVEIAAATCRNRGGD